MCHTCGDHKTKSNLTIYGGGSQRGCSAGCVDDKWIWGGGGGGGRDELAKERQCVRAYP